jgi:hypothetical protein
MNIDPNGWMRVIFECSILPWLSLTSNITLYLRSLIDFFSLEG